MIHYDLIGTLDLPQIEEYPDNVLLDSRYVVAKSASGQNKRQGDV